MKVVLHATIPGLGRPGEMVEVSDAQARNHLLPHRLAAVATPSLVAALKAKATRAASQQGKAEAALLATRQRLERVTVRVIAPANNQGRLFAALKAAWVVRQLEQDYRMVFNGVRWSPDHWKTLGQHQVELGWADGVVSSLKLVIDGRSVGDGAKNPTPRLEVKEK
ncbi:MAG: 50S ribosomal protein L9 [Candidatus Kerfeldbacteria bacterium]|nr:50S ribosomal protein L9 [Candidatus Kerfeldbacteria bacterium]